MNDAIFFDQPTILPAVEARSAETGFTMPSDKYIGSLLKTLMSSKPNGNFLELGTGIGLSLSWMIDGLVGAEAKLTSVDNDPALITIAEGFFGDEAQVQLVCQDGTEWIKQYSGAAFDLVFADAWPGKYSETEEVLSLIKPGGFYVIDDMTAQPNWPDGHSDKVAWLVDYLEQREDFVLTKMGWSTGVMVVVRV
ncbi:O-methyltransferase [Neolewinella agarilytica]|uniref:Predicted O-methyltransferase YrrM n=1 Tax=Neolewinella agarilytica TaxID=478744 RepID=A0A1H9EFA9_9BACT|nr:class I SAM-dependent methyltransferase [Neolewinella agarilytica]SEQ24315.1 Predicted O-methyltransferase YrrM [Neolewinella agarilytica]